MILVDFRDLVLIGGRAQIAIVVEDVPCVASVDAAAVSPPGKPETKPAGNARVVSEHVLAGNVVPPCVASATQVSDTVYRSGIVAVTSSCPCWITSRAVRFLQEGNSLRVFFINDHGSTVEGERFKIQQLCFEIVDPLCKFAGRGKSFFLSGILNRAIAVTDSGKECLESVIVPRGDRVEFVIVAASTANRQSEKRRTRADDDFVQRVLTSQSL